MVFVKKKRKMLSHLASLSIKLFLQSGVQTLCASGQAERSY